MVGRGHLFIASLIVSTIASASPLTDAQLQQWRVLCERASAVDGQGSPAERMAGDFYATGMDESEIAQNQADPLKFEFSRLAALKTPAELTAEIAHLQRLGVEPGAGLPDRAAYSRASDEALRQAYQAHVSRMLQLLGTGKSDADAEASAVLRVETWIAKTPAGSASASDAKPDGSESRPYLGAPLPLSDWQAYLRWRFLHTFAPYLNDAFVREDFSFFGQKLAGATEIAPRWKRVVLTIHEYLPDALAALEAESHEQPSPGLVIDRGPYVLNVLKAKAYLRRRGH